MPLTAMQQEALYYARKRRKLRQGFYGFADDFNRQNEPLEATADWTRVGGIAGGATVSTNRVAAVDTNTIGTAYLAPDTFSSDHFAQAAWLTSTAPGPFICCRITDGNNYVGARYGSVGTQFELFKRVAGAFTILGSFVQALVPGDVIRLECDGDTARVLINGIQRIAPQSLAGSHAGVTRAGLVARSVAINPWLDNFEARAL